MPRVTTAMAEHSASRRPATYIYIYTYIYKIDYFRCLEATALLFRLWGASGSWNGRAFATQPGRRVST